MEQFLFQALSYRHDCEQNPAAIAEKLKTLKIIHPYGYLGPLDWQVSGGRPYRGELVPGEVERAASGIRIIAEGRDDTEELQQARGAIKEAELVFCLGMAFHADNMNRLGFKPRGTIDGPGGGQTTATVLASAFKLSDAERQMNSKRWGIDEMGGPNEKCVDFLRSRTEFVEL